MLRNGRGGGGGVLYLVVRFALWGVVEKMYKWFQRGDETFEILLVMFFSPDMVSFLMEEKIWV